MWARGWAGTHGSLASPGPGTGVALPWDVQLGENVGVSCSRSHRHGPVG